MSNIDLAIPSGDGLIVLAFSRKANAFLPLRVVGVIAEPPAGGWDVDGAALFMPHHNNQVIDLDDPTMPSRAPTTWLRKQRDIRAEDLSNAAYLEKCDAALSGDVGVREDPDIDNF